MAATKAEERKALAQIRKIVDGLGEDSYIGTAFEGCFEIAELNIENDWACNMAQKVERAEAEAITFRDRLDEVMRKNRSLEEVNGVTVDIGYGTDH